MFSPEEIERYARHIVLHGVGGPGQQKLKAARVLVIGAGGLGSPLIQYLAAAGIGEIGILDDDEVSLSNLQRQVLHGTADIGRAKIESAKAVSGIASMTGPKFGVGAVNTETPTISRTANTAWWMPTMARPNANTAQ